MTKYLDKTPFSTPVNSKAYRDNWEETFGRPPKTGMGVCDACGETVPRSTLDPIPPSETLAGIVVCYECRSEPECGWCNKSGCPDQRVVLVGDKHECQCCGWLEGSDE